MFWIKFHLLTHNLEDFHIQVHYQKVQYSIRGVGANGTLILLDGKEIKW